MSASTRAPVRAPSRLLLPGLLAAAAASTVTAAAAALLRAAGTDYVVQGGEVVPVSGIAVVTGVSCLAGLALAGLLSRWVSRPADRFLRVATALTALSIVPPVVWADDVATGAALVGLHLLAAAVMVPVLVRSLRALSPRAR